MFICLFRNNKLHWKNEEEKYDITYYIKQNYIEILKAKQSDYITMLWYWYKISQNNIAATEKYKIRFKVSFK